MLYLIDASSLIFLKDNHYPIERVPEFWEWLPHLGNQGVVKIPVEIYDEITASQTDPISVWARKPEVKQALKFSEEVDVTLVQQATDSGYAPDLDEVELFEVGRDPFLIAYALVNTQNRSVVTNEVSKPTKTRRHTRIPDACRKLGVPCISTVQFLHKLRFGTAWKSELKNGLWPYVG